MQVRLQHADYPTDRIAESAARILEASELCAMATIHGDNVSHINTAYFCYDNRLQFFFLSKASCVHSTNIATNPSMAIAIYDTHQPWDDWKTGIQLFGTCRITHSEEAKEATTLYKARFPDYAKWLHSLGRAVASSRVPSFYIFIADRLKILDEEEFGEDRYVESCIVRS